MFRRPPHFIYWKINILLKGHKTRWKPAVSGLQGEKMGKNNTKSKRKSEEKYDEHLPEQAA